MATKKATTKKTATSGGYSFGAGGTTTGSTLTVGDSGTLSSTFSPTKTDLETPVTFNGQKSTVGAVLKAFESMPASQISQWQTALINAGFMKSSAAGDPTSLSDALNSLLRFSAYSGTDVSQTLAQWQAVNTATGTSGATSGTGTGAKVTVDLTNPLDVQYAANTVAQQLIGRNLTPDEALAISDQMRQEELASGTAKAQAEISQIAATSGQGGSAGIIEDETPTSTDAMTQQYLATNDPGEYQGHQLLNVFQAISQKVATDAQGSGPKAAAGPIRVI